jgi:hypothetical protein
MKQDEERSSSKKPFSYLSLLERADPLRNIQIDYPLPYGRRLSPEELEEQKRQYQHFLLMQTLRT